MLPTLYTADWVFPIASAPIREGAVLVRDGRIAYVGPADAIATTPEAVRLVALGPAALLPGLVNAHSHLELTRLNIESTMWMNAS